MRKAFIWKCLLRFLYEMRRSFWRRDPIFLRCITLENGSKFNLDNLLLLVWMSATSNIVLDKIGWGADCIHPIFVRERVSMIQSWDGGITLDRFLN